MPLTWPFFLVADLRLLRWILLVSLSFRVASIAQGSEQCVGVDRADSPDCADSPDFLTYLARIKEVSIPSHAFDHGGHTVFPIALSLSGDKSVKQTSHRYSEFENLQKKLKVPDDGKFPGHQLWSFGMCDNSCIEKRRLYFEAYLNRALHYINSQAEILTKFMLTNPDAIMINDSRATVAATPPPGDATTTETSEQKKDLVREYNDPDMGIAFVMPNKISWEGGGSWGLAPYPQGRIRDVSIMTRKQEISTQDDKAYGLVFHITKESEFWKYFEAKKHGKRAGEFIIEGEKGDTDIDLPQTMGKDYEWFVSQKKRVLDEFDSNWRSSTMCYTRGISSKDLAGILHYTKSNKYKPTDGQMCATLRNVHGGAWPIYSYDQKSLQIERCLDCSDSCSLESEHCPLKSQGDPPRCIRE